MCYRRVIVDVANVSSGEYILLIARAVFFILFCFDKSKRKEKRTHVLIWPIDWRITIVKLKLQRETMRAEHV